MLAGGQFRTFLSLIAFAMAKEIDGAWQVLGPMLEPMRGEDWDAETKMVIGAVERLSQTNLLLRLAQNGAGSVFSRSTFTGV